MWSIGHEDLRLPLDWMEKLTLREFSALMDRHMLALSREDFFHARTRQGLAGGKIESLMVFKQFLGARKPVVLDANGRPAGMAFGDFARAFDVKLPEE